MTQAVVRALVDADRDRILTTVMEEWSPLQRELMDRLLVGEEDSTDTCDLRRRRSLASADTKASARTSQLRA